MRLNAVFALACFLITLPAYPRCLDEKERTTAQPKGLSQKLDFSTSSEANGRSRERAIGIKIFSMLDPKRQTEVLVSLVEKTMAERSKATFDPRLSIPPELDIARDYPQFRVPIKKLLEEKSGKDQAAYAKSALEYLKNLPEPAKFGPKELAEHLTQHPGPTNAALKALAEKPKAGIAIMTESESLQGASLENARYIRFWNTLALAHRLHSSAPEAIAFDHDTDRFELFKVEEKDGVLTLVKQPVDNCAQCHGTDPHANWPPYNFWKHAVGAFDDRMEKKDVENLVEIKKYLDKEKSPPITGAEIAEAFQTEAEVNGIKNPKERDFRLVAQPNDQLGVIYNQLNFYRLLRIIRKTPQYCEYKFAIYALMLGCDDLPSFLPAEIRKKHGDWKAFAKKSSDEKADIDKEYRKHIDFNPDDEKYKEDFFRKGPKEFYDEKRATGIRYLFEARGISVDHWSIDPDKRLFFSDGQRSLEEMVPLLNFSDSELAEQPLTSIGGACDQLKAESLKALGGGVPPSLSEPPRTNINEDNSPFIDDRMRPRHTK